MTTKRKGYMTLAEHDAQLKAEGKWEEYVRHREAQQAERERLCSEWSVAEAPLVKVLKQRGVNVQSVWDLVNSPPDSYSAAIPDLIEHVKYDYPERIREGILRALATPDALAHWGTLLEIFEHNAAKLPLSIRYVAAVMLSGVADDNVIDDVLRLARDRRFGFDRAPLLLTLQRSKDPRAKMLLLELRDDPELGPEVKKMRRLSRHR